MTTTDQILHTALHAAADASDRIVAGSGEAVRRFADEKHGDDAASRHSFMPPPCDVDDNLCRMIVPSLQNYISRGGERFRVCYEAEEAEIHKVSRPTMTDPHDSEETK